ncbi:MAG: hypothetical protein OXG66_06015, partial [Acidimicrobiaceae bacterium]|nr:hypothetical protein [Acidimicrobiaceae bacterium]
MTVLRVVRRGSAAEMERERAARREARCDIVAERAIGEDRFEARDGPFRDYARTLSMERTGPGGAGTGEAWQLTETTSYRLAVPVWAWLFHFPVRSALRRR